MSGGLPLSTSKLSLLQMIANACGELGLAVPTQVIGNSDPTVTQMLALARREAMEMFNAGFGKEGWQCLRKENTFAINAVSGLTGNFTIGLPQITNILPNTTGITTLMQPYNTTYLPVGTTVLSIDSSTQITTSSNALASGTSQSFFCGQTNYSFPNDLDHFMTQTFWDRNFRWQLLGPLDAQEWQVLKSGISPTGPRRRFRIMDNQFVIDPVPGFSSSDNGAIEVYEYFSNAWCQSMGGTSGTPQTNWVADTDQYCLDDESMTLGIQWRYLRSKRLSYDEEMNTWKNLKERLMARDGAARNLPLNASASGIRLLNNMNTPDTGFGS
jgi:hypothetical protein